RDDLERDLGALDHCHGDRAIERDQGRALDREEGIVEREDAAPVRFSEARCARVLRSDPCLEMIRRELTALRRALEMAKARREVSPIPARAILLFEEHELAELIRPSRQARRVQM